MLCMWRIERARKLLSGIHFDAKGRKFSTQGKQRVKKQVKGKDGKTFMQTFWVKGVPDAEERKSTTTKKKKVISSEDIKRAAKDRLLHPDRFGEIIAARDFFDGDKPLSGRQKKMVRDMFDRNYDEEKVKNIMALYPSVTEEEAIGLAVYVGNRYREVNTVLRGKIGINNVRKKDGEYEELVSVVDTDTRYLVGGIWVKSNEPQDLHPSDFDGSEVDYYNCAAKLARDCLKKMDLLSPESLRRDLKSRHELSHLDPEFADSWMVTRGRNGEIRVLGDKRDPRIGKLRRYISIDEDKIQKMFKEGSVFEEHGFMSTSIPLESHSTYLYPFSRKSNVEMLIDWKKDNSSGKFVDHIKSRGSQLQAEVLFPPGVKFIVESLEKKNIGNETHERVYLVQLREL